MAAGSTYTPIATTTLGSAQASVTFSSISASYTDLIIIFNGTVSSADNNNIQFNSDTSSLYSVTRLYGNGTTTASNNSSNQTQMQLGEMATVQSTDIIQVFNYSNTTTYKTVISGGRNTTGFVKNTVGLYRSTSAISTIKIMTGGANYQTGSTFTLYGITAA
jgi:hypothetical protein